MCPHNGALILAGNSKCYWNKNNSLIKVEERFSPPIPSATAIKRLQVAWEFPFSVGLLSVALGCPPPRPNVSAAHAEMEILGCDTAHRQHQKAAVNQNSQ